jgi:hypothetical protein
MSDPSIFSISKLRVSLGRLRSWFTPSKRANQNQPLLVTFDQPLQVTFDQPLQVIQNLSGGGLVEALQLKARNEAVEYVSENMGKALIFGYREALWNFALQKAYTNFQEKSAETKQTEEEFLIAEFGVWEGYSINYFSQQYPRATIFGFDSFEGLEEDWSGHNLAKGHFDLGGKVPEVADNVTLIAGWFKETVPGFMKQNQNIHFVHFDADTYTPTSTVLEYIRDSLVDGCVFVFDEFLNFPGWKNHEFRAFAEFIDKTKFSYEYIGITDFQQVAVQIYLSTEDLGQHGN